MSKSLTILVDVDGVLEDLVTPWVAALNDKYGTSVLPKDIVDWDIGKFFPELSRTQVFSPLHKAEFWENLQPYADAQKYIKQIIDDGDRVVLVTSAHPDTVPYKWGWINRHFPFIAFKDIIIASSKNMILGDILIDDGVHNLETGNYLKFLKDAPHNRTYDSESNNMVRVFDWQDIYNKIQQYRSILLSW